MLFFRVFAVIVADFLKIWCDHDPEAEAQVEASKGNDEGQALKTEYLDIIVSAVRTTPSFSFSVQILNTEGQFRRHIRACL